MTHKQQPFQWKETIKSKYESGEIKLRLYQEHFARLIAANKLSYDDVPAGAGRTLIEIRVEEIQKMPESERPATKYVPNRIKVSKSDAKFIVRACNAIDIVDAAFAKARGEV